MGVHYDYFRAVDDATAKRLGQVVGGPAASGHPGTVETKWVDPQVRVGRLVARVREAEWSLDVARPTMVLPEEPAGPDNWDVPAVWLLSDQVRDDLASVTDARRVELGRWWATTEEFVMDRVDASYVDELCTSMLTLCRDARAESEHLYVWSSF